MAILAIVGAAGLANAAMVDVTITVDNAYTFGFGDVNGIAAGDLYGAIQNTSACEIFCSSGPEQYTVDTGIHDYVYITAWPDDTTAQGVLGNFSTGGTLLSSVGAWEVFASGDTLSNAAATFNLATINGAIGDANGGTGAANGSLGWVDEAGNNGNGHAVNGALSIDYTNSLYMPISPQAGGLAGQFHIDDHWMWYDNGSTANPFDHTYSGDAGWLVFRADLGRVAVPEPTTALMLGLGLCGLGLSGRRQRAEQGLRHL